MFHKSTEGESCLKTTMWIREILSIGTNLEPIITMDRVSVTFTFTLEPILEPIIAVDRVSVVS